MLRNKIYFSLKVFLVFEKALDFKKGLYTELLIDGTLKQHLLDIDESANERVRLLIKQFTESENINEYFKEHHQMEWVQAMNNIKNRAEEIVLNEIIYV